MGKPAPRDSVLVRVERWQLQEPNTVLQIQLPKYITRKTWQSKKTVMKVPGKAFHFQIKQYVCFTYVIGNQYCRFWDCHLFLKYFLWQKSTAYYICYFFFSMHLPHHYLGVVIDTQRVVIYSCMVGCLWWPTVGDYQRHLLQDRRRGTTSCPACWALGTNEMK
jgi:hypothetical protein